jgi:hypothetical protein
MSARSSSSGAWLYAVRLQGHPGWHWEESNLRQEDYKRNLEKDGWIVNDIVIIADRWIPRKIQPPGSFSFVTKRWNQWLYDETEKCWRAPKESMTPPPDPPSIKETIEVEFSTPEYGWLPIHFQTKDKTIALDISDVYDPLPDIILWLEALANGHSAHVSINTEGIYVDFHVFSLDESVIRLMIKVDEAEIGGEETTELDIITNRQALIVEIYSKLIAFWESAALLAAWDHWYGQPRQDSQDWDRPYNLRSRLLDDYMAKL